MDEDSKTMLCKNCNSPIPEKVKVYPSGGAKRGWWIALVAIVVIAAVTFSGCGNQSVDDENQSISDESQSISDETTQSVDDEGQGETFEWSDFVLSSMLPEPKSNVGEIENDSEEWLGLDLSNVSVNDYKEYVAECKSAGFTVEGIEDFVENEYLTDLLYTAYNAEGYELDLSYNDETMRIALSAPMEMEPLQWPTSEMASMLPVPKSTIGSTLLDIPNKFYIYVGDTSKDDYAAYVDECIANGFSVDSQRDDTYYYASNADDYYITLRYEGYNIMVVDMQAPDSAAETDTSPTAEN